MFSPPDHLRDKLAHVWDTSRPLADMLPDCPAWRYLAGHGLDPATLADVRYHPALDYWQSTPSGPKTSAGRFPALVAAYRMDHTAPRLRGLITEPAICKLAQVYLSPTGHLIALPKPVKHSPTLGTSQGAAVRLAPPLMCDGRLTLGVAAGLSSAARAMGATGVPTWAVQDFNALSGFRWPRPLQRLHIFTDQPEAGPVQTLRRRAHACDLETLCFDIPRPLNP
jgi:hypothetical protein